jgi:hypothetical protein
MPLIHKRDLYLLPMNLTTRNDPNSPLAVTDSPSPLLRGEGRGEGSISTSSSRFPRECKGLRQ